MLPAAAPAPAPAARRPRPARRPLPPAGQACPNCGTQNVADALFCETCGYDFTTGSMPRPLAPPRRRRSGSAPTGRPTTGAADGVRRRPPGTEHVRLGRGGLDRPGLVRGAGEPGPAALARTADVVPLRGRSHLVGRTSPAGTSIPTIDCDADSGVSRRQAQLTTDGTRWWVEDLESANGTFVAPATGALPEDPIPVGAKRELAPDDRIYLGAWTRLVIR